eukprot:CAMPEP_0194299620 /NCGR_PEP_ID=MMETSP0169-20130528/60815_1 /TAXON_ID=218684 /ORGANISM="Corethron pennatum, Strain L29A3" /LENGTH=410 /DNA_ID=CAMNT_0039049725 /DNA_START=447 /DNA_END=1679 /DNA_ORIENTATION=-
MPLILKRHIRRETSSNSECPSLVLSLFDAVWSSPLLPTPPSYERSRNNNRLGERKRSRNTYEQNEMQRGDTNQTTFDKEEEDTPVFRQQEIASPQQYPNRAVMKNPALFPASEFFYPDHVSSTDVISIHTHSSSSEERFEQIAATSKVGRSYSNNKKISAYSRRAVWKKVKASVLRKLNRLDRNSVFSKEEEGYIMSKKRNNPTFFSTPVGTVAKRKWSRNTYGQNELHRRDAYHTTFDKEEANPVFRQQEIASPQHSNRAVMKNSVLFPAADFFPPDHVSSTDATSMRTHNIASEEKFEQNAENSNLRRSYSENKTSDSVSIIGKLSRGAVWKKLKASVLRKLNRLDRNKLEKIASKSGIEMIHVDSTATNGALLERVREWITEDMYRRKLNRLDRNKLEKIASNLALK